MRRTLVGFEASGEKAATAGRSASTSGGAVELTATVPARAESISLVRNAVRSMADGWRVEGWGPASFDEERLADLALVFTELITNAVLHSGCGPDAPLEIRLALAGEVIRGSVTDPGRGGFSSAPGVKTPRVDGGLGLFIVGRLVRTWGVRRVPGGTQVWFEL